MNTEMKLTDEVLMAYADGELDAASAAQVEQALRQDAAAMQQVERHRALRARLQTAFAGTLHESVPDRLLHTVQAAAPKSTVVSLQSHRQQAAHTPPARQRWQWPQWGAMAASLVAGAVLTLTALSFNNGQLLTQSSGNLVARGALARALNNQLASTQGAQAPVHIGISYRNQSGNYCRSFTVQQGASVAGVACHEQNDWRVQVLASDQVQQEVQQGSQPGNYQQAASSTPAIVLTLIEQQMVGEPLDAAAEASAQRAQWR